MSSCAVTDSSKSVVSERVWYVLHVSSRAEEKIGNLIMERAKERGCEHLIDEVLSPLEKHAEVRRGKKIDVEKRLLPGYLLVKMVLNDQTRCLVQEIPGVRAFLGAQSPHSIPHTEMGDVHSWAEKKSERVHPCKQYDIGEEVRVMSGPFRSFSGFVEDIDIARSKIKVGVSIFGRLTPVELEHNQVQKI